MIRREPAAAAAVLLGSALLAACTGNPVAQGDDVAGDRPSSTAAASGAFTAGATGIGDPYFPLDGNGGHDVGHYDLDLSYDAASGALAGSATISATATQGLASFDLDFDDLEVLDVAVDGGPATWTRRSTEISALTGQPLEAGSHDPVTTPGSPASRGWPRPGSR